MTAEPADSASRTDPAHPRPYPGRPAEGPDRRDRTDTAGAPEDTGGPAADGHPTGHGHATGHPTGHGHATGHATGHGHGAGGWAPGEHILWRYRANGAGHPHICRPVTVVQDTPALLAAWMAPGTVCVKPQLADGTEVHHEPLATRYTKPRTTALSRWFGTGVLKLARPGQPWSVWLFWDRGWRFKNFYVNLEEPRHRWAGGIDSEDHFLDIAVYPDRSWEWRDEDEFAQAQRAGLMDRAQADRVRAAGRAAVAEIRAWGSPFADGWEHWRPDPRWTVPPLPEDWDRAPVEPERERERERAARPRRKDLHGHERRS